MTARGTLRARQLEQVIVDYLAEMEDEAGRRREALAPEHGWKRMHGWAEHQLLRMRVEQESTEALLMVFQSKMPLPEPAQRAAQNWNIDWNTFAAEVPP